MLVLILFVITGCEQGSSNTNSLGAKGLIIKFLDNNPPMELRENQNFRVAIEVENGIKKEIPYTLCVSDTPSNDYGGIKGEDCIQDTVPAAIETSTSEIVSSFSNPIYFPEREFYSYNNLEFGVDTSTISAEVSYDLDTVHTGQVCLLRDFDVDIPSGVDCGIQQTINGLNSEGGPIEISKVDVDLSPQGNGKVDVFLDVTLRKTGEGKIIFREPGDNSVSLEVRVGNTKFECSGLTDGLVKMTETNKKVNCKAIIQVDENTWGYTDVVKVRTSYTHVITESKSISLKSEVGA